MVADEYVTERLEWVTHRLKVLDKIDEKLQEMKAIAEYARDNELGEREKEELNRKINQLGQEVQILHEKDKNFWLEWQ